MRCHSYEARPGSWVVVRARPEMVAEFMTWCTAEGIYPRPGSMSVTAEVGGHLSKYEGFFEGDHAGKVYTWWAG